MVRAARTGSFRSTGGARMKKAFFILWVVFAVATLFSFRSNHSLAQSGPDPSQCEQVRHAVAQYGYAAARRYALANYGKQAVQAGEKCLTRRDKTRKG